KYDQQIGEVITEIPTAQKTGYTFKGWYCKDADYTLDTSDIFNFTQPLAFKAVWEANSYTVSFENGESYTLKYDQKISDVISAIPVIEKTGYTFKSWYCESENYTLDIKDIYRFTEEISFIAVWEKNIYTVRFDPAGGEMTGAGEYGVVYGETISLYITSLPEAARKGHSFEGWYCAEKDYIFNAEDSYSFAEDIVFSAIWKPLSYKITFDPNGGEMTDLTEYSIEYGKEYSFVIPYYPEAEYYAHTLVYWFCEEKGFVLDLDDVFDCEEDIVFKAVWDKRNPDYDIYDSAAEFISNYQNEMLELFKPDNTERETVDIILFAGQSNSSGRAIFDELESYGEYITVDESKAFTFNNNKTTQPVKIEEPIPGNGTDGKYYGYVPALLNSYYDATGRRVCACFKSVGGMMLNKFLPYTIDENGVERNEEQKYYKEMVEYVNYAKENLVTNGYEVGNILMVWCQGEADAAYYGYENEYANVIEQGITEYDEKIAYYKSNFNRMFERLQEDTGMEKAFFVRIGHSNKSEECLRNQCIIDAQSQLCRENGNYIMVSTLFAGAKTYRTADGGELNLMRDASHYIYEGYLMAGWQAGLNMGIYVNSAFTVKPLLLEYHTLYLESQGIFNDYTSGYEYLKYIYDPYK
ncbi:MAG: InlB B-repeat-containing protein, partial [Clostridia bacterium]|nr:InlB B-repeat-containing protein [Clostridia bacterium]